MNNAIHPIHCSLTYTTVDKVAQQALPIGRGALMAKVDIEATNRLVPVHPQDQLLLGLSWEGSLFVDPMLPFELRLAPKIFNAIADVIQWHVEQVGVKEIDHYLDNFIVPGSPRLQQRHRALCSLTVCMCLVRDPPGNQTAPLGIKQDNQPNKLHKFVGHHNRYLGQ